MAVIKTDSTLTFIYCALVFKLKYMNNPYKSNEEVAYNRFIEKLLKMFAFKLLLDIKIKKKIARAGT